MRKRIFDLLIILPVLIVLSPLLLIISIYIISDSKGPVFFRQMRVGKDGIDFLIYKFRTMYPDSDRQGFLTIGGNDSRITPAGIFLRKYKLDELPQLLNVLNGSMSLIGPRPEVRKYVDLYSEEQKKVLTVKPGITDYASIEYSRENELLANATDPEYIYIHEIMPAKILLNMKYIQHPTMAEEIKILWLTFTKIFSRR